jgi:ribosomal protein S18 acetylase RimI-like enzyme
MSELRPTTPARRPETARPRYDAEPDVDPPSPEELAAVQRNLIRLPVHGGARIIEDLVPGVVLVRHPGEEPAMHRAAMPRWAAGEWRARLAEVVAILHEWGAWPSIIVADRLDLPIGLGSALAGEGWLALAREHVLWVGRASVVPHLDPRMRIEAVRPGRVEEHEALERTIFGLPDSRAAERRVELQDALRTGTLRAWLVLVGDEPVAVARLSQGDGVAGIYGLGVAKRWRRRGYGTLLTTVATRAGLALGNRIVWLSVEESNEPAQRVYRALGFQPAFSWERLLAPPA